MKVRGVRNGRVELALHERKAGQGDALLLLHALYGSSEDWGAEVDAWPGPVFALDWSGHGASGRVRGGAYTYERYIADADLALRAIGGPVSLVGAGMGAWYGLLLAGTRAEAVPGCLLLPGAGLDGCGERPDPRDVRPWFPTPDAEADFAGGADPFVSGVEREPRPRWFSQPFAEAARRILLVEEAGAVRPAWWAGAREAGARVVGPDLAAAIAALAAG